MRPPWAAAFAIALIAALLPHHPVESAQISIARGGAMMQQVMKHKAKFDKKNAYEKKEVTKLVKEKPSNTGGHQIKLSWPGRNEGEEGISSKLKAVSKTKEVPSDLLLPGGEKAISTPSGKGGGGKDRGRAAYPCGGAPPSLLPFPHDPSKAAAAAPSSKEKGDVAQAGKAGVGEGKGWAGAGAGGGRRLLSPRRSLLETVTKFVGCSRVSESFHVENSGEGIGPIPSGSVDSRVVACLKDIKKCTPDVPKAVGKMRVASALSQIPRVGLEVGGKSRFNSCALVGNAGNVLGKKYGQYIDKHELVVRFNTLSTKGFEKHVGSRTSVRVLNHKRSVEACCPNSPTFQKKALQEGGAPPTIILWHPGGLSELRGKCKKRFPRSRVLGLNKQQTEAVARAHVAARGGVAHALGKGGLGSWKQLTSGGHAVYLFWPHCESISMYGFTSFPSSAKAPDQYGGRQGKAGGASWHDWDGEAKTWRLLHAHGKLSVCSL